jgi:hypothetical protein
VPMHTAMRHAVSRVRAPALALGDPGCPGRVIMNSDYCGPWPADPRAQGSLAAPCCSARARRLKGTWGSTVHTSSSRAIRLQEHACHCLLDEHDQAFIASRALSSLPGVS